MFQQKKPYSAVTVTIENLTGETYDEEDFSGIPELVEVIKLQATGPTEAARAIRKKLKYGSVHRQIRALVILDGLIQNAGPRFQRAFADEPLLERLRVCGTSDLSDPDVKKKCRELFRQWSAYSGTPGLSKIAALHKELPKKKIAVTQERSKVIRETDENPFGDDEEEEAQRQAQQRAQDGASGAAGSSRTTPSTAQSLANRSAGTGSSFFSSSKDKKKDKNKSGKRKPFDLEAEKENMKAVIADASITSTNLMNALQTINRETERISENPNAVEKFEACKQLRRRVLRYIHHVEHEQYLGSLLNANDALVHALMSFEQMDHSIDADSDSDDELAEQAHMYKMIQENQANQQVPDVGNLSLNSRAPPPRPPATTKPGAPPPPKPPRPGTQPEPESEPEDDNDPFGDKNIVETPAVERTEPKW